MMFLPAQRAASDVLTATSLTQMREAKAYSNTRVFPYGGNQYTMLRAGLMMPTESASGLFDLVSLL